MLALSEVTLQHTEQIITSCPNLSNLDVTDCKMRFDNGRASEHANLLSISVVDSIFAGDQLAAFAARCKQLSNLTIELDNDAPLLFHFLAAKAWPALEQLRLATELPPRSIEGFTLLRFLTHCPALHSLTLPENSLGPAEAAAAVRAWQATERTAGRMMRLCIGDQEIAIPRAAR